MQIQNTILKILMDQPNSDKYNLNIKQKLLNHIERAVQLEIGKLIHFACGILNRLDIEVREIDTECLLFALLKKKKKYDLNICLNYLNNHFSLTKKDCQSLFYSEFWKHTDQNSDRQLEMYSLVENINSGFSIDASKDKLLKKILTPNYAPVEAVLDNYKHLLYLTPCDIDDGHESTKNYADQMKDFKIWIIDGFNRTQTGFNTVTALFSSDDEHNALGLLNFLCYLWTFEIIQNSVYIHSKQENTRYLQKSTIFIENDCKNDVDTVFYSNGIGDSEASKLCIPETSYEALSRGIQARARKKFLKYSPFMTENDLLALGISKNSSGSFCPVNLSSIKKSIKLLFS